MCSNPFNLCRSHPLPLCATSNLHSHFIPLTPHFPVIRLIRPALNLRRGKTAICGHDIIFFLPSPPSMCLTLESSVLWSVFSISQQTVWRGKSAIYCSPSPASLKTTISQPLWLKLASVTTFSSIYCFHIHSWHFVLLNKIKKQNICGLKWLVARGIMMFTDRAAHLKFVHSFVFMPSAPSPPCELVKYKTTFLYSNSCKSFKVCLYQRCASRGWNFPPFFFAK